MKSFNGIVAGAFTLLASPFSCCCGRAHDQHHEPPPEKSFVLLNGRTTQVPSPASGPSAAEAEWRNRQSPNGGTSPNRLRKSSVKEPSPSRRPQISPPTNFRHVDGQAPAQAQGQARARARVQAQAQVRAQAQAQVRARTEQGLRSFRPLELSIYDPDQRLSPILPHVDSAGAPVTPPRRAVTRPNTSGNSHPISHTRTRSTMSFHLPRKPTNTSSISSSPPPDSSDVINKPAPAQVRPSTSPESQPPPMDHLVEKVAEAMLERDFLQSRINDVIERQSIYVSSRPSTAHSVQTATGQMTGLEAMPGVPALPPDAPSFRERLSYDRPRTAPSKDPAYASRRHSKSKSLSEASTAFGPTSSRRRESRLPPPPPLPLHLRQPLRNKRSFSSVSSWLGSQGSHSRHMSLDSVTNVPLPVSTQDGFYEVAPPCRLSFESTDETVSESAYSGDDADRHSSPSSTYGPSSTKTATAFVDPLRAHGPAPGEIVGVAL